MHDTVRKIVSGHFDCRDGGLSTLPRFTLSVGFPSTFGKEKEFGVGYMPRPMVISDAVIHQLSTDTLAINHRLSTSNC